LSLCQSRCVDGVKGSLPDLDGNNNIHDQQRTDYLRAHIQTVAQVIRQGVPIKGYVVWSLLDNYEWSEGYGKRFGLVYIDYPTGKRVPKSSFYWFQELIRSRETAKRLVSA